jgi:hypothetical protein
MRRQSLKPAFATVASRLGVRPRRAFHREHALGLSPGVCRARFELLAGRTCSPSTTPSTSVRSGRPNRDGEPSHDRNRRRGDCPGLSPRPAACVLQLPETLWPILIQEVDTAAGPLRGGSAGQGL